MITNFSSHCLDFAGCTAQILRGTVATHFSGGKADSSLAHPANFSFHQAAACFRELSGAINLGSASSATETNHTTETVAAESVHVGKTVGPMKLICSQISAFKLKSEREADMKGDFHEVQISVKQSSKPSIYWGFGKIKENLNQIKTITVSSNHGVCGESCGDRFQGREEMANG